jgi:acetylornithine/succinyldiaminopimelate/putrescine aminotransferase
MGNGMPVSGLVAKPDVLASFSDKLPYFTTFGGNRSEWPLRRQC